MKKTFSLFMVVMAVCLVYGNVWACPITAVATMESDQVSDGGFSGPPPDATFDGHFGGPPPNGPFDGPLPDGNLYGHFGGHHHGHHHGGPHESPAPVPEPATLLLLGGGLLGLAGFRRKKQ